MYLDSNYLENIMVSVERKVKEWNKYFPQLKFDKWGRVRLMEVKGLDRDRCLTMRHNCSENFREAFNEYLEDKDYRIRDYSSSYYSVFFPTYIAINDYIENYYHFKKEDGKVVKVKASRVLSAVHKIWIRNNPRHTEITDRIKELREQGFTYSNCEELCDLANEKDCLEEGNLHVLYQKIMNQCNGKKRYVYLTINPLDLLTSSGDYGDNPTNFGTCWSTDIRTGDYYIKVYSGGCYSNPDDIITLGKINNRGMLYIPNGREVNVPGTEFSLLGYRERIHCWFDTNPEGIWLEKVYPSHSNNDLDTYKSALKANDLDEIDPDFYGERDFINFNYQDSKVNNEFSREHRSLFLDKVGICDNGYLHYLPNSRVGYDYRDNINGRLDEHPYTCEDCGDGCYDEHYVNNNGYVCDYCVNRYIVCYDCNDLTHEYDYYTVNKHHGTLVKVCEDCRNEWYVYCEHCDEYHHYSNTENTADNDYACIQCIEKYYSVCEECGEYTNSGITNDENNIICIYCSEKRYHECVECGTYTKNTHDVDGKQYCGDCVPVGVAV